MTAIPLSVQAEIAESRAMRDRLRDLEARLADAIEHAASMESDRDAWKEEAERRLSDLVSAGNRCNEAVADLILLRGQLARMSEGK